MHVVNTQCKGTPERGLRFGSNGHHVDRAHGKVKKLRTRINIQGIEVKSGKQKEGVGTNWMLRVDGVVRRSALED